jgi:hypothetical protein
MFFLLPKLFQFMTKKNSLICKKDFVKKTFSNSRFGKKIGLKLPFIAYKFLQHSDTLEGFNKNFFFSFTSNQNASNTLVEDHQYCSNNNTNNTPHEINIVCIMKDNITNA